LDKTYNTVLDSFDETLTDYFSKKYEFEKKNALDGESVNRLSFLFTLYSEIFLYVQHRNKNNMESSKYLLVMQDITTNALKQFQSILLLYISGQFIAVLPNTRILYESFIEFFFIKKYNSLAEPFYDHGELMKYKLFSNKNPDDESQKKMGALLQDYGDDFLDDYGWTKSIVVEKRKRNLKTLATDINAKDLQFLYDICSNFVHPNSYSVYFRNGINKDFAYCFMVHCNEMIFRIINSFVMESQCAEKDRIILTNILYSVKSTVLPTEE
jgi:hypothetical protein